MFLNNRIGFDDQYAKNFFFSKIDRQMDFSFDAYYDGDTLVENKVILRITDWQDIKFEIESSEGEHRIECDCIYGVEESNGDYLIYTGSTLNGYMKVFVSRPNISLLDSDDGLILELEKCPK